MQSHTHIIPTLFPVWRIIQTFEVGEHFGAESIDLCAADVRNLRMLNFPDIYRIMSGKRMVVTPRARMRSKGLRDLCRLYI